MREDIRLVMPTEDYTRKIKAFRNNLLNEGCKSIEGGLGLFEEEDTKKWIQDTLDYRCNENLPEGMFETSVFLAIRNRDERIIGVISIRHELSNDYEYDFVGHISYTQATMGSKSNYASLMIGLIAKKAKSLDIPRLLITCDSKDIKARKAILKSGGKFASEIFNPTNAKTIQRYWIQ